MVRCRIRRTLLRLRDRFARSRWSVCGKAGRCGEWDVYDLVGRGGNWFSGLRERFIDSVNVMELLCVEKTESTSICILIVLEARADMIRTDDLFRARVVWSQEKAGDDI